MHGIQLKSYSPFITMLTVTKDYSLNGLLWIEIMRSLGHWAAC